MTPTQPQGTPKTILKVWNLHTRIFHWLVVILVFSGLSLGMMKDNELMIWHYRCGYALLGLIGFRLVIGLMSGDYARFRQFPINPLRIPAYLKGQLYAGHNPLGVWMIMALLLAITIQGISGLFTSDSFWLEGPWVQDVSENTVSVASAIHGNGDIVFTVLIGIHLLSNIFYSLWKKNKLIRAMVTGNKEFSEQVPFAAAIPTSWTAIIIGLIMAGLIAWIASNP
jgi:cytochrome b